MPCTDGEFLPLCFYIREETTWLLSETEAPRACFSYICRV